MSFKATAWAVEQTVGDMAAKFLLLTLAESASSEDFKCWPSIATLSRRIEASEDTVARKMKILVSLGLVIIEKRARPDGSQTSNCYQLVLDAPPANSGPPPR